MIRQLTDQELTQIESQCRPFEFAGDVAIEKTLLLSLLNEVRYQRGRHAAGTLEIRSLVSMRDSKPYVSLTFGNTVIQLSIQDTIDHAKRLLEVAAGAAADGFLVHFHKEHMKIDPNMAMHLLRDFRAYRDGQLGLISPDDLPAPNEDDQ